VFTTLAHLIDTDFLREAYQQTSKSSAAGIDGVTAQQYAEHLDENLRDLHERLRSGRYQAAPVERVWSEKDDGGQRPIGKPTFEDKIVQRAVAMLLEAIYEQKRSMSKTSTTARMAFGQDAAPIMHCKNCESGA
jgi:RNA-directed DNA polymerase